MNDEDKKTEETAEETTEKVEEVAEQAEESAEKAENAAEKAEDAADEAKEAAEEVKEAVEEVKEEPKPASSEVEKKETRPVSAKLEKIIKDIETMSVLELADLVKALEERFGVSAAAPVAVAAGAAPAAAGDGEAADEGQTSFNVVLTEAGANKISVIKAVREIVPTLGLAEAKALVDSAPKPVLEGAGKDAANEAKGKLEAAGGKVELK